MGAVWKFSHSAEQTMPSLKAIPSGAWKAMMVLELLCSLALILPAFYKPLANLVPLAGLFIVIEMLLFCGLHLRSGNGGFGPMMYWLVVVAVGGFIAYGRFVLRPF
jgi:hypothetical protein